ncbi:MAG TPA: ABC transporter ATP-binding protein [Acidobacteriota bacterium]|nr:ABC transporter ATP-binding protein [Acidobacteriota bacterium]
MSASTRIEIQALGKEMGGRSLLRDVTLAVRQGEICCLVGPNGAGKTTLLHCLMGLRRRDCGRILINGVSHDDPAIQLQWSQVGFLPQNPQLYPHLKIREHLVFVAQIYKGRGSEIDRFVDQELARFGLQPAAESFPETLSRGEYQKAALVSTRVHSPSLLVYDEPDTALDDSSRRLLVQLLTDLVGQGGAALIATHDLRLAESLTCRLAILNRGNILFDGRPQDLRLALHAGGDASLDDLYRQLLEQHQAGWRKGGGFEPAQ